MFSKTLLYSFIFLGFSIYAYKVEIYNIKLDDLNVIYSEVNRFITDNVQNVFRYFLKADEKTQRSPKVNKPSRIFSASELSNYNGADKSDGLYLALLGKVYDVESGRRHYGPGGNYHYFAGKDASRSFITGDSDDTTDDVLGLSPSEVKQLKHWVEFYKKNYKYMGKLIGRYYDEYGNPTPYFASVRKMMKEAQKELGNMENDKLMFPPCNSEWSQDAGTTVWCSNMSGGIQRDWVGVPRMLYEPGSESYRCACIKDGNEPLPGRMIREYPSCDPTGKRCKVHEELLD